MIRKKVCYHCKTAWRQEGLLPFDALCSNCGNYLHCCRNCAHYDPLAPAECREADNDPGAESTSKNFCDPFRFRESFQISQNEEKLDRRSAEDKWKDLFRDPG
ncbi:MAG: hypothetical protein ABIK28_23230 [Planctomycetota bacterium]